MENDNLENEIRELLKNKNYDKDCIEKVIEDVKVRTNRVNTLETLSIQEIYEKNKEKIFKISSYQRLYKWTQDEIKELLNDFKNFFEDSKNDDNKSYCLQPMIVKELWGENKIEIVDGQQRLTTIDMILSILQGKEEDKNNIYYGMLNIEYDRRENTAKKITIYKGNQEKSLENYNLCKALDTIKEWISKNLLDGNSKEKFIENIQKKVEVIWYSLAPNENSGEVFSRVNAGRIPLTQAELIKALFLRKNDNGYLERNQYEIATKWDEIERKFNDNEFWYFLNNEKEANKYSSVRIDELFDLYYKCNKEKEQSKSDSAFYLIERKLEKQSYKEVWQEVEEIYNTLDTWYKDEKLRHLIGYIIYERDAKNTKKDIKQELISNWKEESKERFIERIIERVKESIGIDDKNKTIDLDKLSYEEKEDDDYKKIKNILLLFNLANSINQDELKQYEKISFYELKQFDYTIEHIRPQNPWLKKEESNKNEKWKEEELKKMCSDIEELSKVGDEETDAMIICLKNVLENKSDDIVEKFKEGYNKIFEKYAGIEEEKTHRIGNLALLDKSTNSKLSNKVFPIKKQEIIKIDSEMHKDKDIKEKVYILPCTRKAFLKYYSHNCLNYSWDKTDFERYQQIIKEDINKKIFDGEEVIQISKNEGANK